MTLRSFSISTNLIVEYELASSVPPFIVDQKFREAISAGGVSWMPSVTLVYGATNGTDTATLVDASTTTFTAAFCSDPNNLNQDFCILAIGGAVLGLVLIISLSCCIWRCCCQKDDEEEELAEAAREVDEAANKPKRHQQRE
jgi:hypothetical protein